MKDRIKISLRVKRPNDFLKRLVEENINLYQIEQKENQLICVISRDDYDKIHKIKNIHDCRIIEFYGKSNRS